MDDRPMTFASQDGVGAHVGGEGQGRLKPGGKGPWRWVWLALALVVAVWAYKHFTAPSNAPAAGGGKSDRGGPQPIGVAVVQKRNVAVSFNALGTATPLATVTVVSQISGYLREVAFTEGQRVKKGDFLAQIDDRPYQALKAQYEGQLAHDQGLLDQAKIDDARYQVLLKQNSIARQQAEDQIYIVKQYEGTVRSDQAQIDAQALNIAYCHIISPVDGRIGLRQVDAGNFVQAGASATATAIAVVAQTQPMTVVFSVPEDVLGKIAPKLRGGGQLDTSVFDRANVKKLADGKTYAIDSTVDTTTGMVKLRARFDNADEALFPNMFVNVRLLADMLPQVVAAPAAAIQHGAPGDYAYIVTPEGKASVRVVKLGQVDGDFVQVLSGLNPGDRVVIDGADRLREGADVRVVAEAPTDGAPAPAAAAPPAAAPAGGDSAGREERRRLRREKQGDPSAAPDAAPASAPAGK